MTVLVGVQVIGTESAISVKTSKGKRDVLLSTFGLDEFQQMCILSGCDYLPKKVSACWTGRITHLCMYVRRFLDLLKITVVYFRGGRRGE